MYIPNIYSVYCTHQHTHTHTHNHGVFILRNIVNFDTKNPSIEFSILRITIVWVGLHTLYKVYGGVWLLLLFFFPFHIFFFGFSSINYVSLFAIAYLYKLYVRSTWIKNLPKGLRLYLRLVTVTVSPLWIETQLKGKWVTCIWWIFLVFVFGYGAPSTWRGVFFENQFRNTVNLTSRVYFLPYFKIHECTSSIHIMHCFKFIHPSRPSLVLPLSYYYFFYSSERWKRKATSSNGSGVNKLFFFWSCLWGTLSISLLLNIITPLSTICDLNRIIRSLLSMNLVSLVIISADDSFKHLKLLQ